MLSLPQGEFKLGGTPLEPIVPTSSRLDFNPEILSVLIDRAVIMIGSRSLVSRGWMVRLVPVRR